MSKTTRNTIIIMGIALLIFAILFAVYGHFKTEPISANTAKENIIGDANTGLENLLNDIFDEENGTNETNNELSNQENAQTNTNTSSNKNQTTTSNPANDNSMTPKENKAIELAKKQWIKEMGNDKDVSFSVSIQNDGKYGVTVYDTTTTRTIQFYVVDVENETVKER